MVSRVDTTKWFELTEDSDTDDDLHHSRHKKYPPFDSQKKHYRAEDPSLSQYSLQLSQLSSGNRDEYTNPLKQSDSALSQYSLGQSQLSAFDETKNKSKMDNGDGKKVDVESLHLQFQTLLTDDSQEEDSTQLSSASDQQGSTTDDPWRSATETSDGPSLSEYPLGSQKLSLDDEGQTATEESSGCEEVLYTAISEVSKDFISGNLSSYPLQSGDSDLSSDDQKVLQKHLGGKYPETAVGMSDSDWNVTESDTNGSPRAERTRNECSMSTVSSFSPPLSSTVLTNNSTVGVKQGHGLSMIQEASVENTASFKELPSEVTVSRGSFLGRDHEKYLDSMRTIHSSSVSSLDSAKYLRDLAEKKLDSDQDGRPTTPDAAELTSKSGKKFENKELSPTAVYANFNKSSNASTSQKDASNPSFGLGWSGFSVSHTTTSMSRDSLAGSAASSSTHPDNTRPLLYLDPFPSKAELARKSEQILDKTLSRLNLKGSSEGRYSFPLSNTAPHERDDFKRHSLGRLESSQYSVPRLSQSRQEELVKSLSGSTQSYMSDDLTRSVKSVSSDSTKSAGSDEVARLMARSGSSAKTTLSRGDEASRTESKVVQEARVSAVQERDESRTGQGSRESVKSSRTSTQEISSRVNSVLAETAYIDNYSSPPPAASENRNTNYGSSSPSPPSMPANSQRSSSDYPLPPPPIVGSQLPSSDQPLPPPPNVNEENPASVDYRRLHQDLQEIQNSLQNNLDFDSGNDSVQSSDAERDRLARTPVGSETGSEIIPSTTTTPDRSRRLMWDYGADIACEGGQPGRFTSRDTDATDTDNSESQRDSYVDQAQVARNASKRHPYNSEGEETHTSGSSVAKTEEAARAAGTDDELHTSRTNTPTGRNADEILSSFRAQRSLIETHYLHGMAGQVSNILSQQDPEKHAHGILDEVRTAEQELLTRLANRPPLDSSFTDTSANMSNRSLVITDSDVRRRLEMSGLSSPDRSRNLGNTSFMEFSTPRKITNPFAAFSNAKTFLSSQLEEMSNKTFNHSIELRTPLRHVVDCYPLYGVSKRTEDRTDGNAPSASSTRTDSREGGMTETSQSRNGRGQPEGISPDEFASRTRLSPDLTPSVESTQSMTDRRAASSPSSQYTERNMPSEVPRPQPGDRFRDTMSGDQEGISPDEFVSRTRLSPDLTPSVESTQSMTDRRAASSPSSQYTERNMASEVPRPQPGDRFRNTMSGDQEGISPDEFASRTRLSPDLTASVESTQSMTDRRAASSPSSQYTERNMASEVPRPQPGDRFRDTMSGDKEDTTSPTSSSPADLTQHRDKLRPYRPAGSRDLYYTESDTASVADSVTTMESTHTGSDDAVAPNFPPHVLGTRRDGPSQPPASRKHQTQGMQLGQALSTIEEKSVTDERDRTSIESLRTGPEQMDSQASMRGQDSRPERAVDGVRPRSPRDTLSKLEARTELDSDSGIGSRSNFTSTGVTDTSQERRSQIRMTQDGRNDDHLDHGSRSDRLERDETLRAARKVLEDIDGRSEVRSQGQFDGNGRSRSGQDLAVTSSSSTNQLDDNRRLGLYSESRSSQYLDNRSGQKVNSGARLYSDGRSSRVYDSRSGQTRDQWSRQTLESQSGQTLDSRSGHNLVSGASQSRSSEYYVDNHSAGRDLPDQDPYEARLRLRTDGDLINKHRESSSPIRNGRLPEPSPHQSPIHHHSTLRESQMQTDPRHSTAIDSSSIDYRQSGSTERLGNGRHQREGEAPRSEMDRGQVNGTDGRPRSSDRKDSRQRMEQNRKARRGQIDMSSSEDDSNRAIDHAPVSRPAQLLREALEQEVDPNVPANINMLWQRFQELNPTDSDTSLNTTRMEQLAHLLRNPAKHLVTSYFEDRASERKVQEEKAAEERERRREDRLSQKLRNVSESESNGSYTEVIENRSSKRGSKSNSVKKMNKKNSKVDGTQDSENLYSIPEDISFDYRRAKKASDLIDPNMEKLREKIERQKEKIERERRKELKRMEKLVKLESLLSAKKKGKISESTLLDQLEYISTTSVPTDSTEEITESTLTVSGANSETLTDDTTTAKDSSLEMQMVKYARNMDSRLEDRYEESRQENTHPREVDFMEDRSRKAEKVRVNERLKEQTKSKGDKNKRRSKERFPNEEESLYDYREVDIHIVDKPRHVDFSPDRQERSRGRMRDAATNYPSPVSRSPQSQRRSKQRKVKSEGIQTTPNLLHNKYKSRSASPKHHGSRGETGAPFTIREKTSRSRSPPYSRQFTPESMENQQPKRKQKKLPVSPKGIAWYVEVKESRPWRQPLKERQAYAVRQAWVPDTKSQWQTAQPRDINEDDEMDGKMEIRFVVDKLEKEDVSPKLIDENYTSKKGQSLQDAFGTKMQQFISRSRERQKRMALAAEHRRMQEGLRREREKIFADKRKSEANPNAHPYSENLLRPKKRVFSRQEQKDMTKKMYNRLPEVIKREENQKRENQYKLYRLRAKVFTKRVQRHVLIKAGSY